MSHLLPVQLHEQLAERCGRGVVEGAGGFVGEQQLRLVDERADDGHALTFATTELSGTMMQSFREADAFEQPFSAGFGRLPQPWGRRGGSLALV